MYMAFMEYKITTTIVVCFLCLLTKIYFHSIIINSQEYWGKAKMRGTKKNTQSKQ